MRNPPLNPTPMPPPRPMPLPPNAAPVPVLTLDYARPTTSTLLPVRKRTTAAVGWMWAVLWACVVVLLFATALLLMDAGLLHRRLPAPDDLYMLKFGIAIALIVIAIDACIHFCRWQLRVHSNAIVLADRRPVISPIWGVASWFVPILNLILPFVIMHQIDRATPPPTRPLRHLIGWCWVLFVIDAAGGFSSAVIKSEFGPLAQAACAVLCRALNVVIIALLIRFTNAIGQRQAAVLME